MLYGDSGTGKSSLVNAGFLPQVAGLGLQPERVRVQPRAGEELVIQRIPTRDDDAELLPSLFTKDGGSARPVLSTQAFIQRVRAASKVHRPLIVFDQFEEILTLFQGAEAEQSQARIADAIVTLLHDPISVKLLFVFREDYLGRVKQLLAPSPELVDQALRLTPPSADALPRIIRGPFERFPQHFVRELSPELTDDLRAVLAERFRAGDISLTEVQTVCVRLWQADDPRELLAEKGVQGLLEDYLGEALYAFPPDLREPAIALLSQMVTSAGTRNVMSAEDLMLRVREDEKTALPVLERALERLESESKLVRRERRRDLDLYEVTSEFLLPWISRRRDEFRRAHERRRYRRRVRILASIAGVLLLVVVGVGLLAAWAFNERNNARRQADAAASLALAGASQAQLESRPDVSLLLAVAALDLGSSAEARYSMITALATARRSEAVGILHGHPSALTAVTFSRDGRKLITSDDVDTVRVWDVNTKGQLGPPLEEHIDPDSILPEVAYSPDGRTIAVAGDDDKIRLWDARSRKQNARPLTGQNVTALTFSAGGRTLASAGWELGTYGTKNSIRLWDVRSHRLRRRPITIPTEFPDHLALDRRGRTIAFADDRVIRVLDLRTGRQVGPALRHGDFLADLALSPEGRRVAASYDGTVRLWDVRTGRQLASPLAGRLDSATGLSFSADGRILAFGADATVRLWDVHSNTELASPLTGHTEDVADVAFSPDGRALASAGNDDTVRLWDVRSHTRIHRTTAEQPRFDSAVEFSADGRTLASANGEMIQFWDVRTTRPLGPAFTPHPDYIAEFAFSPDGETLASVGIDDTVRLWNVRDQSPAGPPLAHDTSTAVTFSPDGRTLASAGSEPGSDDDTIRIWDARTHRLEGQPFSSNASYVGELEFDPEGKTLLSAGSDEIIRLWDVQARKEQGPPLKGFIEDVYETAFSPDGEILASTGGQTIQLWDLRTRQLLRPPLTGHTEHVRDLSFSPDGRLLASAGDRTVRLWDVRSRRQIASLSGHARSATGVVFNPDGRGITSAGGNGFLVWERILFRDFAPMRDEVCAIVGTGLTRAEWDQYAPGIPYNPTLCP